MSFPALNEANFVVAEIQQSVVAFADDAKEDVDNDAVDSGESDPGEQFRLSSSSEPEMMKW